MTCAGKDWLEMCVEMRNTASADAEGESVQAHTMSLPLDEIFPASMLCNHDCSPTKNNPSNPPSSRAIPSKPIHFCLRSFTVF